MKQKQATCIFQSVVSLSINRALHRGFSKCTQTSTETTVAKLLLIICDNFFFTFLSSLQPLSRPPIPSHQVPPYRGVSARFRPSALSQSTPIGLDRVGRRKLHRVLSGENWADKAQQKFVPVKHCTTVIVKKRTSKAFGSLKEICCFYIYLREEAVN